MDKIHRYQYIASLIVKESLETIDETERAELAAWKTRDEKHQQLYNRLKQQNYTEDLKRYRRIDVEEGWLKYRNRYGTPQNHRRFYWRSVAAAVVLLFSLGIYFLQQPAPLEPESIAPGSSKATLILSDGSVRELIQGTTNALIQMEGVTLKNTGNELLYLAGNKKETESPEVYNTLKIPAGGEYRLVLSDGTRVWLNSDTRLRYPVDFSGDKRQVWLQGEAYFEVTPDKNHPFIVKMKDDVNVQVLGTSFNITAYEDENKVSAVLEEGCVKMWKDARTAVLLPGSRAIYDKRQGEMRTDTVDTELYTAWRNGNYVFRNETIGNILQKLARWYDVDVFFADEAARNVLFSGSVRRYETIQSLLDAMELSGGICFRIKGNTITVYSACQ